MSRLVVRSLVVRAAVAQQHEGVCLDFVPRIAVDETRIEAVILQRQDLPGVETASSKSCTHHDAPSESGMKPSGPDVAGSVV